MTRAFAPKQDAATLKKYFNTAKRFLAYLDRVGTSRNHHFTVEGDGHTQTLEQSIELTDEQLKAWSSVRRLARQVPASSDVIIAVRLRDELVRTYMDAPYRLPYWCSTVTLAARKLLRYVKCQAVNI